MKISSHPDPSVDNEERKQGERSEQAFQERAGPPAPCCARAGLLTRSSGV